MSGFYTEYNFTVSPTEPWVEILLAELAEIGFESFEETETGLLAYIPQEKAIPTLLDGVQILHSELAEISYSTQVIEPHNWNEKWESNFNPIEIGNLCRIRASFHPKKEVKYDIVINPKMSFGTGHHATTNLMVQYILEEELTSKKILDMGSGTGVLAILASMKNSGPVDAIDIDPWCYENALENTELNLRTNISVYEGDASLLKGKKYDVILANINRNILVADMDKYAACLPSGGQLFLSGFYETDLPVIIESLEKNGLKYLNHKILDNWVAVKSLKI